MQASLLIHRASQWTGFFMLRPSITNELIFARKQLTVFANKLYLTGHLILLVCYTRLSFEHEMLLLKIIEGYGSLVTLKNRKRKFPI